MSDRPENPNKLKKKILENIDKVIPIKLKKDESKHPGHELFGNKYPNIYILAKTESGKTTTISYILDKITDSNTIVVFFVDTIKTDATYRNILQKLKKRKIPYIIEESLFDEAGDHKLWQLYKFLKKMYPNDEWADLDPHYIPEDDDDDDEEIPDEIKETYKNKSFVIVMDDLSEELRKGKTLEYILKKARHARMKIIVSTHDLKDITPPALSNMKYILLYPESIDEERLKILSSKIGVPYVKLLKYYKDGTDYEPDDDRTKKSYNFLFIDRDKNSFRKNFHIKYE